MILLMRLQAPHPPVHPGRSRHGAFGLLTAAVLCLGPAAAPAQDVGAPATQAPDARSADTDLDAAASAPSIAPPSDVEVIRIKGRGVSAIETDVPASVTQFDASALEALGAQNISDLAQVTPNVEIKTAGATSATFFIRGVGLSDFSSNAAGAVAIYQDDVAFNAPAIQLGQLFDIENVEVLRGPQGGGSARNASAGAIKAYSRKPTGEFSAQLRSSFGTYASPDTRGALIQDYEGAIEVPLVEEVLSTRLAFRFLQADPFMTNGCGNAPAFADRISTGRFPNPDGPGKITVRPSDASICGELSGIPNAGIGGVSPLPVGLPTKVGDRGSWAARGQIRFLPPGTDMDWLVNLHGSRLDQQSTLGQAIGINTTRKPLFGGATRSGKGYQDPDQQAELCRLAGGTPVKSQSAGARCARGPTPEALDAAQAQLAKNLAAGRTLDTGPFRGDYDRVGQTRLDSWGGFVRGDMDLAGANFTTITAYDAYNRFRDTDQDFTPEVLFEAVVDDKAWQFSQDLRLSGELPDAPFRWEAGAYYLMEQLQNRNLQLITNEDPPQSLVTANLDRRFRQNIWSFLLYGGFSWDFLDAFTLEGGLRYNWERKSFDIQERRVIPGAATLAKSQTKIWTAPTGTLSLTYRFNEDASVYWKYSRGFKAGHFNSNKVEAAPARPETIDAFETGLRGRWFEGRLGLGGAFFFYKYVDYQVFLFESEPARPPSLEIQNANDAQVFGAEADLRIEPLAGFVPDAIDGLVLTARFGWLESEFLDFTDEVLRVTNVGQIPVTVDFSGNPLINSPKFKVSGGAEWTFDLGRFGSLIPRYDFAWTDDIFFDASAGRGTLNVDNELFLPKFAVGQPSYWLHNLRGTYRTPDGNMEIAFWCRNCTDTRYKQYAFDASFFTQVVINFVGQPRTIGVDLSISW